MSVSGTDYSSPSSAASKGEMSVLSNDVDGPDDVLMILGVNIVLYYWCQRLI